MKKMLVCAAALSFALVACADDCCGDESSSGANGRKTNRYETLHVGDCDESFSHCPRSTGAFMLQGEDGGYQVLLDGIQIINAILIFICIINMHHICVISSLN